MAGTVNGGLKAAETNKARYGENFYRDMGKKGGKRTGMKDFALDRERAARAGRIGGTISRRGKAGQTTNMIVAGSWPTKKPWWKIWGQK